MDVSFDSGVPAEAMPEGISPERRSALMPLETDLGHAFQRPEWLSLALTHSSAGGGMVGSNERLEFFGDAILDFLVCELLFVSCPGHAEGVLTEMKSAVVRRQSLAVAGRTLQLERYMILGRGIANQQTLPGSVFANAFEAVIAAVYLDGGMEAARGVVLCHLAPLMNELMARTATRNYKSLLQEWLQKEARGVPEYVVRNESGPEHAKDFLVAVLLEGEEAGVGRGKSKKLAEQDAARKALDCLGLNGSGAVE